MSLRDELEAVRAKHGRLTPAHVVEDARPADHPLHDRFDWDNRTAGESWRRQQASELIRSVRVMYREPTEDDAGADVRAYHAVRRDADHEYVPVDEVAGDPMLTALVLNDMRREWLAFQRRYGHMVEFVELVREALAPTA
jgi:hypothetical protein